MNAINLTVVYARNIAGAPDRVILSSSVQSGDLVRVLSGCAEVHDCWGILRDCVCHEKNEWTYRIVSPTNLDEILCSRLKEPDSSGYAESLFMPILESKPYTNELPT